MIKKIEKLTVEEVREIAPGQTVTFCLPSYASVLSANSYISRLRTLKPREDVANYSFESNKETCVINITAIGYNATDTD